MFITANDFGNGNSYADGSRRTSCQAQKKPRVAFPGLSTQVPQPHSVAGHFLPLTDTGCVGKGLGAELALKETESSHILKTTLFGWAWWYSGLRGRWISPY